MLVWIDLETTGLDPGRCRIIEVACVITENDLTSVAGDSWLVRPPRSITRCWDQAALDMHRASGLLDEALKHGREIEEVEDAVLDFVNGAAGLSPLCGSSVHFDRAFLVNHMPTLLGMFTYRNIDVSSLKELVSRWAPDYAYPSPEPKAHRALPDIINSINELRHYKELLFP